jgi:trk system potassium uptake protein TrkA
MNIIICGAGQVGFNLAKYLCEDDHNITVIDIDEDLINDINERLEVRAICGHASHPEVLCRAGIEDAHMIIAVTQHDEVNIVACEVTNALFKGPIKIARIRSQAYLNNKWRSIFAYENISIDHIISPEIELADAIHRSLRVSGAFNVLPLSDGFLKMVAIRCTNDNPLVNTPIRYINSIIAEIDISVIGIVRESSKFIPHQEDIIMSGDDLYFIVSSSQVSLAMKAFGYGDDSWNKLVIFGGGQVGMRLAQEVERRGTSSVCLIEKDEERAQEIAELLEDTIVLNGDCLDSHILEEADVMGAGTVVAVTQDDKVNVLSSLLAKKIGAQTTLALVNNPSYGPLLNSLGVDGVIDPRSLTVSKILHHIRKGKIRNTHSIADGLGEIIEGQVSSISDLADTLALSYNVPGEILVAAIVRESQVIIPNATTMIKAEDRVIIISTKTSTTKVERLFANNFYV